MFGRNEMHRKNNSNVASAKEENSFLRSVRRVR